MPQKQNNQARGCKAADSASTAGAPDYWQQASSELANNDPVMCRLISQYADTHLQSRGEPFITLARSIVSQQISVKAAESIWNRLLAALSECSPQAMIKAAQDNKLQSCGLSASKQKYLLDLAQHFADGQLNRQLWENADDAEVIRQLSTVRGIGRWTAEMFLIFNLCRPDVFPVDDIGLQRALARQYFDGQRPTRKAIEVTGERFRPWRTVATFYLWRSLDPVAVEY